MAYVTEDKRVKPIIAKLRKGLITDKQARIAIKDIPPAPGNAFAFLNWEIEEAINSVA